MILYRYCENKDDLNSIELFCRPNLTIQDLCWYIAYIDICVLIIIINTYTLLDRGVAGLVYGLCHVFMVSWGIVHPIEEPHSFVTIRLSVRPFV